MRAFYWCLGFCLFAPGAAGADAIEAAQRHRQAHQVEIVAEFADILRVPNVPDQPAELRRAAADLVDRFGQRGVELELRSVEGAPPLVIGRLDTPGATRTLGVYLHYDGQPVDPAKWAQPPFEPTLYSRSLDDGGVPIPFPDSGAELNPEFRLYARSAGDDRAPAIALLAALDALAAADLRPTSNFVFLFEGEEEQGSPHLREGLLANKDDLMVDLWLICDGPTHQSGRPQLVFGVRGVTGMELTVYGAARSLHSGHYGNWAPNPGMMLSQLLASMKDEHGDVIIDGFYDTVDALDPITKEALTKIPEVDTQLRHELGLARVEGTGQTLTERLLQPSLNVRGLDSAQVGDQARNVIPNRAVAALDIRMVRGNEPQHMMDLVEAHIRSQGYHIVREDPDLPTRRQHPRICKVTRGDGYRAASTRMDHPLVPSLIDAANRAAGEEVILMPSLGGSLPLYLFEEVLAAPVVIVPIANHDNNQHAPNENIRIGNLWYGIDLMAALLTLD